MTRTKVFDDQFKSFIGEDIRWRGFILHRTTRENWRNNGFSHESTFQYHANFSISARIKPLGFYIGWHRGMGWHISVGRGWCE